MKQADLKLIGSYTAKGGFKNEEMRGGKLQKCFNLKSTLLNYLIIKHKLG